MSESKLYHDFKKQWKLYIKRIETKLDDGMPDVHLINTNELNIFLELKYLPKMFIKRVLPIKKSQFIWHANYAGKHNYMLFQVEDHYFLFKKKNILQLRGEVGYGRFCSLAEVHTKKLFIIIKYFEEINLK